MKALRKKVYMVAGYNTVSMGTGRKEFHPKKPRPDLEHYIKEAGQATLKMIGGAENVDEGVIGNFMASRFNKQANLPAFLPMIDEGLKYKPAISVEGACASGGLALASGIKSILAETADVVLAVGFEVQNTMKAMYGADVLAGAGWMKTRKEGHAYFFPGVFSNRAGAYYEKFGKEKTREAMAKWYCNAIENARLCETAQEFHNKNKDLEGTAKMPLNPKKFVDHLNYSDCSKVSDGASAIAIVSEEGLKNVGIDPKDAVEVVGIGQAASDITKEPENMTCLTTMKAAAAKAMEMAGITVDQIGTVEVHDCFSIAGIMGAEAIGFAEEGKGVDFVLEGHTSRCGKVPFNTTGGLIGWGHPTGATGVHQAVTIWEQLTGKAGDAQIEMKEDRPYGMTVNMGGDDKSLVAIVYKRGE
ncbi:thiolase C-terminal domain-containing protein [Marinifilum flexuosum]|uniref:Acetyl-CoA C-acetyltransferase/acetyl-CoA acyltransferase n=1 Tax=Marinifilum flexuosum TaxID=1117708 RepID=A0A419WSG8_9BACT|nr:beta-ketoacyl synthase N-terminal-like domain-containing protein [Marinifilum flexuosum]RKD98451.1 acetyl-CoA C-acetyltransferase/acetyl-CoA acyltransferase [Marinifilum flexuosum]